MKMDKNININSNGGNSPPHQNGTESSAPPGDDFVEKYAERLVNSLPDGFLENLRSQDLATVMEQASRILPRVTGDIGSVEGIDPASPLGRSLQRKFSELEEISRRLKTRLNQVVCDTNIVLSTVDESGGDIDLERDLNTDSQAEDLTPQEFFQLVQSQIPGTSHNTDNSEKSNDVSK